MSAITAGEAYVVVTCDTQDARNNIYKFAETIQSAAHDIERCEKSLKPKVDVEADESFQKKIEKAKEAVKYFASFAADAFASFRGFANYADSFDKMSQRVGVSTESLSELAYAANLSGTSIERVEESFKGLSQKIVEAVDKGGDAEELFSSIGLSAQDLAASTPEEQFYKVADAIAEIDDPTRRAAVAMQVFGESGRELLPLLSGGSAGLAEMRDEARSLGATVSTESAAMGAQFNDALARVQTTFQGLKNEFAASLAPILTTSATLLGRFSAFVSNLTRECPVLTTALATFGAGVVGLSYGLTSAMNAVENFRKAWAAFQAIMAVIPNPIVIATTALVALGAAAAYYFSQKHKDDVWSNEKQKILEAGDALRQEDQARMDRLVELKNKETLTTEEIGEAARLASVLNDRYGEIGVSVDAVTGKITMAADAQKKFNEASLAARKAQLQAAIDEKNNNLEGNKIRYEVASEEVSNAEVWKGDVRNPDAHLLGNWGIMKYSTKKGVMKEYIARGDADYEEKVRIRIAKETAERDALQAELDALNASDAAENEKARREANVERAMNAANAYAQDAQAKEARENESGYDRERLTVRQEAEKEREKARKAIDANVNWNDAESVSKLFEDSPELKSKYEEIMATIDAVEKKRLEKIDAKENVGKQKAADDRKDAEDALWEMDASLSDRKKKALEDYDKAREEYDRMVNEGDDAAIAAAARTLAQKKRKAESLAEEERRLEEEKAAQAEAEAEKKRQEMEAQARRNEEIMEEQRRMREEQERQRAEEAERQRLASEERAEAEREYFYQYASIDEQWFARNQELLAAQQDLQAAQKKGDDAVVAAAYRKVVDAQRDFDSIDREVQSSLEAMGDIDGAVEDAVGSIDKKTGSSGTFSAYQAQEIAFGDYQRKLYDQSRTQTDLLRQLVSLNREGGTAAFA